MLSSKVASVPPSPTNYSGKCVFRGHIPAFLHRIHSNSRLSLQHNAVFSDKTVYRGVYGDWTIEESDLVEVAAYRAGLTMTAVAAGVCSTSALVAPGDVPLLDSLLDPLCLLGAGGLGVSLFFIHIYVTSLKRALQAFWALGTLGGVYLMATQDTPAALYVAQHSAAVWLVGPLFAALTGVAFKEGLCYGKPEAAALFFVTPTLLGGHLLGILPSTAEDVLLATFVALLAVFAGRKYTQAVKDDIGDKSIFMFQAMSEEQQQAVVDKLRQE